QRLPVAVREVGEELLATHGARRAALELPHDSDDLCGEFLPKQGDAPAHRVLAPEVLTRHRLVYHAAPRRCRRVALGEFPTRTKPHAHRLEEARRDERTVAR